MLNHFKVSYFWMVNSLYFNCVIFYVIRVDKRKIFCSLVEFLPTMLVSIWWLKEKNLLTTEDLNEHNLGFQRKMKTWRGSSHLYNPLHRRQTLSMKWRTNHFSSWGHMKRLLRRLLFYSVFPPLWRFTTHTQKYSQEIEYIRLYDHTKRAPWILHRLLC